MNQLNMALIPSLPLKTAMHTLILIPLSLLISACSATQPSVRAIDTSTKQVGTSNTITRQITPLPPEELTIHKTALVIGNADYKLMPLVTPENDAADIAEKLKSLDFEVIFATNSNKVETKKLIRQFGEILQLRGGLGLFFYAGHNVQMDGQNYLIPIDFRATNAYEVSDEATNISLIKGAMEEAANPVNIIILDAYRDHPFPRNRRSSSRTQCFRVSNRNRLNIIIAHSTSPGMVTVNGNSNGRNSIYTQFLLKHIGTKGVNIVQVFKRVRIDVMNSTQGKQIPWETIGRDVIFYLNPDL